MKKETRLLLALFLTGVLIGSAAEAVEARHIIKHMPVIVVRYCHAPAALAPEEQL